MADTRSTLPGLRTLMRRGMPGRQEREAETARALQERMLPREMPRMAGFRIGCAWQGSQDVSGDYFDAIPLEGRMALCLADVAGKGLEAAELAAQVREAVRRFAPRAASPAELCTRVNQALSGSIAPTKYITLLYAVLEPEGRVQYENAGHCQPLLVRRNGDMEFPASFSGVVGIFSHWLYRDQEIAMGAGDALILMTDGLLGAEDRRGEEFGYRRLIAEVERLRGAEADEMARKILAAAARFCGGRFRDDASLIAVTKE